MKNIENLLHSKEKINNFISFKSDDSSEDENIIFPTLNKDLNIKRNNNNKVIHKLNENKKKSKIKYIVEKGILINPIYILSNNNICFGSKNIKRKIYNSENNKNLSYESFNIQIYNKNNNLVNSKNNMNTINKLSLNNSGLFEENKNNININNMYPFKHTNYKSRNNNLVIDDNFKAPKTKNFFTNETLSSCCKVLFDKKINKINNKEESTLNSNRKSQITFNQFLINKNNKKLKNNNPILSKQLLNDYKYKTMYNKYPSNSNKKKGFINKRRKYQFKCNPYMVINKFIDLPERLKDLNKNNLNSLKKEANKYFGNNFSLIQTGKFSYKFRNPLFNSNLTKEDIEKSEKKTVINENIISGIEVLKEINDKNNKEKNINNPKRNINKKRLLSKFKSLIIKNSNYLKKISVSSNEIINKNINKKNDDNNNDIKYYENKNKKTNELIQAIKTENFGLVKDLIEKNIFSVTDYDIFQFTPLHWAIKKNFYLIIPKLVSYGAQVNSQNFLGETPLHISIKNNFYECTVLLLIYLASPFIKNNKGKKPFDYTNDYQMNIIYKKIINLHYKNMFSKNKLIYENIQNEFINFILEEFSTQIKRDCLIIVEDIERDKKNRAELELKIKKKISNIIK